MGFSGWVHWAFSCFHFAVVCPFFPFLWFFLGFLLVYLSCMNIGSGFFGWVDGTFSGCLFGVNEDSGMDVVVAAGIMLLLWYSNVMKTTCTLQALDEPTKCPNYSEHIMFLPRCAMNGRVKPEMQSITTLGPRTACSLEYKM